MSECMTQEDAINMSNEQAVAILKPLRDMMRDQYGCPISDAYFALDKAITALLQPQHKRGIRFYIPKDESIPTDLRLYVGENYVEYEHINNGFLFKTLIDDEEDAMKVVEQIVNRMKSEHDESEHGVSWRTISLSVVPQDERYKIGTWVEWKYRVRDSY